MGRTSPQSSRVRGVFRARDVVPHLSSQIEGDVFDIALHSGRGHRSSCDHDVRRLDSCGFSQQAGRESVPLPLLVGRSPSEVVQVSQPPSRYGISARAVLCSGGSPQPSGSDYRGSVLSPPADGDRSAAWLGSLSLDLFATRLPAVLPLFCSLVPNPQVVFLDALRIPWGNLGIYAFPPFLSSDGWWLMSERPQSLYDSGRPPLAGEGVVRRPSPSLPHGFPSSLMSWQGFLGHSSSGALSRLFTQSLPCRTWFGRPLVKCFMFLRHFSKTVEPEELRPPPWVVTLVLRGLTRDLYVPFWSSDECFLAQSLLFLLALASTKLTGVLHVLFVLSLSLQGLAWVVFPLRPGFRGEGAGSPLLLGSRASLYRPYQMQAQSHWETVRSSGTVRFSLAITTPHRL